MKNNCDEQANILLIEDSEDDAFFFRRSLAKAGIDCRIQQVADGLAATIYLSEHFDRPQLVFLDLKIPHLSGFEVLKWIQEQPFKSMLEVVVLSGSSHGHDIEVAERLGAADYLTKPLSPDLLSEKVRQWRDKLRGSPALAPATRNQ